MALENSTAGRLDDTSLAQLLIALREQSSNGTLELTSGADHATVVFHRGKVLKIRTSAAVCYLGTVAYELGLIDAAELDASLMQLAKVRAPHGQILVSRGALTREQLGDCLREQTLRKLTYLFSIASGATFVFTSDLDSLDGYGGTAPILVDPLPGIWRGVRDYPSMIHVASTLDRLGEARLHLPNLALAQRFAFQPDEHTLIECLSIKPMTVRELSALNAVPSLTVSLIVYCLALTNQLALVDAPPTAVARPEHRTSGTRPVVRAYDPAADLAASCAKTALDGARVSVRRNDLERAARLARFVCESEPDNASAVALAAWVEALRPGNDSIEATLTSIRMLDHAVDMDVLCQDALYFRAQLHSRLANHRAAVRDLQRLVEINPHNGDGVRALRVYHMRMRNGSVSMRAVDPHPTSKVSGVMSRSEQPTVAARKR